MGPQSNIYKKLSSKERKLFLKALEKQFGFREPIRYDLFIRKDKIYAMCKEFSSANLKNLNINSIGLYIAKKEKNRIRFSIEGSQIIGSKSTKNIFEVTSPEDWLQGKDIENKSILKNFVLIKYKNDFLGCGFCKNDKVLNYIPKSRRLRL